MLPAGSTEITDTLSVDSVPVEAIDINAQSHGAVAYGNGSGMTESLTAESWDWEKRMPVECSVEVNTYTVSADSAC